jgi:hypothetical protein
VPKPRRKTFYSLMMLMVWTIWLERNARVFRNQSRSVTAAVDSVFASCDLWRRARLVERSQLFM